MMNHHPEIIYKPAGIYIHVPFCIKKCDYCDFYSITDLSLMDRYAQALISEISLTPSKPYSFDSIYFGGGTPSLLKPKMIDQILKALSSKFHITDKPEITLEANPKTINIEDLKAYKNTGINRIHLGVQSFSDIGLNFLGRLHTASEAKESLNKIRQAGYGNLGIDLIYGLPGQSKKQWIEQLKQALSFSPEHLSCYMLTYESGTLLDNHRKAGKFEPLSDEGVADLFETAIEFLTENGFFQYEISNYAKIITTANGEKDYQTFRSRHNQKYWNFTPYLGFGASAHSFENPIRYWNIKDVYKYIDRINTQRRPVKEQEVLNRHQQAMETISLRLRTREGIDIRKFETEFDIPFFNTFGPRLNDLITKGFLVVSENSITLTPKGMLLLNSIAALLVDCF